MKHYFLISLTLLLSAIPSNVHAQESCSCKADDGSCTASIDCPSGSGCVAFCPSNNCHANCVNEAGYIDESTPTPSPTSSPKTTPTPLLTPSPMPHVTAFMTPSMLVTLKITGADSRLVAYALKLATNREVEFRAFDINRKLDFDFKSTQLWSVLESISQSGKLIIGGIDFEDLKMMRRPLMLGERVSMCIYEASLKSVVSYLSFLSGLPLAVVSGDAEVRISASLKRVTFNEIIARISIKAGVRIEVGGAGAEGDELLSRERLRYGGLLLSLIGHRPAPPSASLEPDYFISKAIGNLLRQSSTSPLGGATAKHGLHPERHR